MIDTIKAKRDRDYGKREIREARARIARMSRREARAEIEARYLRNIEIGMEARRARYEAQTELARMGAPV